MYVALLEFEIRLIVWYTLIYMLETQPNDVNRRKIISILGEGLISSAQLEREGRLEAPSADMKLMRHYRDHVSVIIIPTVIGYGDSDFLSSTRHRLKTPEEIVQLELTQRLYDSMGIFRALIEREYPDPVLWDKDNPRYFKRDYDQRELDALSRRACSSMLIIGEDFRDEFRLLCPKRIHPSRFTALAIPYRIWNYLLVSRLIGSLPDLLPIYLVGSKFAEVDHIHQLEVPDYENVLLSLAINSPTERIFAHGIRLLNEDDTNDVR